MIPNNIAPAEFIAGQRRSTPSRSFRDICSEKKNETSNTFVTKSQFDKNTENVFGNKEEKLPKYQEENINDSNSDIKTALEEEVEAQKQNLLRELKLSNIPPNPPNKGQYQEHNIAMTHFPRKNY
ncbi:hypothetical protein BB559_001891 [Furculomyces boomerangus]|uniref:Uncharacterized protein n=1 Tax=Furculomyces boomerangus TaxID=61424 RepID=A0A2T9YZL8_9FUNG|nr:hypothetical protein BB559_001891 [Furculomyces boomerangus]